MQYVAIDFETANERRDSPCALALVKVDGEAVVGQGYWLIRPHDMCFSPYNMSVNGIGPEDVADAPGFDQLWHDELSEHFENALLVAHFSVSVQVPRRIR